MFSFTINTKAIASVVPCCAKNDIRYFLNGVFVEIIKKEVRFVGTNGRVLAVHRQSIDEEIDKCSFIIPLEVVEMALKLKRESMLLEFNGVGSFLCGIRFDPVEGLFPDYRRVMPESVSGVAAQFSLDILAKVKKVEKIIKSGVAIIKHNGTFGFTFYFESNDDFVGCIMPYRAKDQYAGNSIPTWAKQ